MPKTGKDEEILKLITKLYVDIYNFTQEWNLPDDHNALVNFIGRGMNNFLSGAKPISYSGFSRKSSFSSDSAARLALKIVLRALQIGREINRIRIAQDRPTFDWYARAVEEDNNEKDKQESSTTEE